MFRLYYINSHEAATTKSKTWFLDQSVVYPWCVQFFWDTSECAYAGVHVMADCALYQI